MDLGTVADGRWDVILVGSGITALSFGVHLLEKHPGKRVLVLEKHYIPGGYASVFRRGKVRYDCSLHKLAGLKRGNTRRILDGLGIFSKLDVIFHENYFQIVHGERCFGIPNSPDAFKQTILDRFPEDKEGIEAFFRDVEVHGKNGYHQFQIMNGTYLPDVKELRYAHRELKGITVQQALQERIRSPLLREILGAPSLYAGGFPGDLSYFYYLHIIYASLYCGTGYLKGGSQRLTDILVERIRGSGEVLLRTTVKRVLVDASQRAFGVETDKGRFLGEEVVLNCSPHYAVGNLFAEADSIEPVKRNLEELAPSRSTTTLFCECTVPPEELGLDDCETMLFPLDPEMGHALRASLGSNSAEWEFERAFWQESPVMVTNYHLMDGSGGKVVQLNILDVMDHWPEQGTFNYAEKKKRCERILLERLYVAKPNLRGQLIRVESSTPHTYERYTNNYRGAGYGAMVGTSHKGHLFHRGFPIKNVHFMSSWVAGPSYEAALGYAEMRADEFYG